MMGLIIALCSFLIIVVLVGAFLDKDNDWFDDFDC